MVMKSYSWDCRDPVWCSSKVLDRTSRGPRFNSARGPDFFTISIQCVFVSQCFIIDFIIIIIIFVVANLVTPYYFSYSVGKSEC